uniref:Uncharacterized protein n=1 Tax=Rhizophagus irregularis (strain DAOM 181602 / DAOM 197198 / MUCL 43194) TaxID=747089 RepID=U9TZP8_RHIID
MANIAYTIINDITNKKIDISNLYPIFQKLICIQSEKFLHWAISVYSRSEKAAYDAMKTIMRLPSISTLKSYINKSEKCSGW